MYFSDTAQEAHNKSLARQAHKTILVTRGAPCNLTIAVEHSSTAPLTSGSLAAQLSDMLAPVNTGPAVNDSTTDTELMAAPVVPPASTSTPMDVDEAAASPSGQDIGMNMSAIYFDKTP